MDRAEKEPGSSPAQTPLQKAQMIARIRRERAPTWKNEVQQMASGLWHLLEERNTQEGELNRATLRADINQLAATEVEGQKWEASLAAYKFYTDGLSLVEKRGGARLCLAMRNAHLLRILKDPAPSVKEKIKLASDHIADSMLIP